MRVFKSLLVAVGIFVLVFAIAFVAGVVVVMTGQVPDANGITSTTSVAAEELASEISGIGVVAGVVLGAIAGIVYGVNRPSPAPPAPPAEPAK